MSWKIIINDILINPRYVSSREAFIKNDDDEIKLIFKPRCYYITIYLKKNESCINERWEAINVLTKDRWQIFEKNRVFEECKLATKDN